jgi:IclR family transcriptional regulator, pca regulon regulatory protein
MIMRTPTRAAAAAPTKRPSSRGHSAQSKNSVLSLAKGFRVLEAFSGDADEMTLSEVANAAGLDAGTCFRMLNTLLTLGYVARVPDSRRFRLTLKVLDLGFNAIARKDQRAVARPVLQSLVDEVSEAASFGVLEGGDVLYIERVRAGFTRLGVDIRIGTTIPASTSAIGYAILAFLPPDALDRSLSLPPRHPLTAPVPSRVELAEILDRVRGRGYILQESLISGGLHILAAPVLNRDGHAIGAVSVTAPMIHTSEADLLKRALDHLLAATRNIAGALEASGSSSFAPSL